MAVCARCGSSFETRSPRAKYCSDRCRKQVARGGALIQLPGSDKPAPVLAVPAGPIGRATLAELSAAGRVESSAGQVALALAARLDDSRDMGSAFAALAARHEAHMALALRGVARAAGPGLIADELAARRRVHGA